MSYANVTRLPAQRVPLVDEKMPGLVSRDWYRFFQRLFELTGAGSDATTITDTQIGPLTDAGAEISILDNKIQRLQTAPEITPAGNPLRYGSFVCAADQTAAVVNTAYDIPFATVRFSWGVYQPVANTKITVDRPGLYLFDLCIHIGRSSGSGNVYLWAAVNGTDVVNSASQSDINSSHANSSVTRCFMLTLNANDYVEIKWSTTNTGLFLDAVAASSPRPAIPAAILNVSRVGDL
jgi:hypothetical protein